MFIERSPGVLSFITFTVMTLMENDFAFFEGRAANAKISKLPQTSIGCGFLALNREYSVTHEMFPLYTVSVAYYFSTTVYN